MSKVHCVVGGQFGSEAKGAVAAFLSTQIPGPVVGVRVGGPNAGHTVYGNCPSGCAEHKEELHKAGTHPWRLRQVPVLAVSRSDAQLVIAAGSEIDIEVLLSEIDELDSAGYKVSNRVVIDLAATVIEEDHKAAEASLNHRIGSTAKGIGAARADRIMRTARTATDWATDSVDGDPRGWVRDAQLVVDQALREGTDVIIEGTQGYGLGLHTKYYPYTTSGDCRAIDLLAQVGISPWGMHKPEVHVWLVVRPNPIRVAGNSGPLKGETTWANLGRPEEMTTVTHKVRRVGAWDPQLVDDAVEANGGASDRLHLVLTMVDHLVPKCADMTAEEILRDPAVISLICTEVNPIELSLKSGVNVQLIGTGPRTMAWLTGHGVTAVRQSPIQGFATAVNRVLQVVGNWKMTTDVGSFEHTMTDPLPPLPATPQGADELFAWWMDQAQAEVEPMVAKALEYGGHGAALDLIDIGSDLFRLMGREPEEFSVEEATELGIYFYLKGKFSRWTAALLEGRSVSDDTLLDIGVYVRMAQRNRAVGGWPYGSDKSDG